MLLVWLRGDALVGWRWWKLELVCQLLLDCPITPRFDVLKS